jgi:hypothetical protein
MMAMVRVACSACGGIGTLPALGKEGNPLDVKRFFPRICEACNFLGYTYIDKDIVEKRDEGNVTVAVRRPVEYIAGQGDC